MCPPAIPKIARRLYEHPEGLSPRMQTRTDPEFGLERDLTFYKTAVRECAEASGGKCFLEATGEVGDVYLLHPMMVHCATTNPLRRVRIITNPPVSLRQPHKFDRSGVDGDQHSLVELKTIRAALGDERAAEVGYRLEGWRATGPREAIVPQRVLDQEAMKKDELKRLAEVKKLEEVKTVGVVV